MKKITLLISFFYYLTISSQVAYQPNDLVLCDDDNDGFSQFDLSVVIPQVLDSQNPTDFSLSFYVSQMDADNGVTPLLNSGNYSNISNPQPIFVRLEDVTTGNFDTTTFNLIVNSSPILNQPTPLELCDFNNPGDEQEVFALEYASAEILNGQTGISLTIHETIEDAENAVNPILSPYVNTSNPQTIFVRAENDITGCFNTVTITLKVNPIPSPESNVNPIEVCDDDNDGIAVFDLTYKDTEITAGNFDWSVAYYVSSADAQMQTNVIPNPTQFTNTVSPQTIYARVVDTNTGCFAVVDFDMIVNSLPEIDIESSYDFCVGDSLILDTELSASDYAFQWVFNGNTIPGEMQSSITVTQSGLYNVTVIALSGCGAVTTMINVEEVSCTDADSDGVIDSDEDLNDNGNLEDDDTDGDDIPNYLDDDDDGDGVETIIEINIVLGRSTIHPFVDTDNDLIENYLDNDDDGDGVLTIDEDYNNNGDPTDDDTNMNTIPDYLENSVALGVGDYSITIFKLFPNPTKDEVNIQLATSNFGAGKVNIYNIQGKAILKQIMLDENTSTIDISSLESGLYFVELAVGNTSTVQKLIVN